MLHAMRSSEIALVAGLIGDPTRAAMLDALMDGREHAAGELARRAGVMPSTASGHLSRLLAAELIVCEVRGRERRYRVASAEVAAALEALARIAPAAQPRSLRAANRKAAMCTARTCYDHLAGRRGVELRERLLADGALRRAGERDHVLTEHGRARLEQLGLAPVAIAASRRVLARTCIDWTHRRAHLAGALPAAVTARLLELGWLSPTRGRALRPAADYEARLDAWLAPHAR
jgi:DNA-binding transcriptional ArsR family regulator